jgi:hypothetical protein
MAVMARFPQPVGTRGSLKWIQRSLEQRPAALDELILAKLDGASSISWRSPLREDHFAEYRDRAFLERIGAAELAPDLERFWPSRGPQWDALGRSDAGDILLVEAKAHFDEVLTPPCQAGEVSRCAIEAALSETIASIGAAPRAAWSATFYQLANRLAHLYFLRKHGRSAWLVLVNFVGDAEMHGPSSEAEWEAAYRVVSYVLGLPRGHALDRHIVHVYPSVAQLAA